MYFEMHKHTQFSMFDGFDKINNIADYAKELGMKALGISDHGNACGILQLYKECKARDIKPLMGCEVYFQPKFDSQKQSYHLCLYAYNNEGYKNLCKIITEANEECFYRRMHVTFENLRKHSEGIICTSACVAGFISQRLIKGKIDKAEKAAKAFKKIFGDNFYLEIQPIKIDDERTQEKVNEGLMELGKKLKIKCILTTDSHYTRKEDFDTYLMMHKMSHIGSQKGEGFTIEHIEKTYKERYMHSEKEICKKFEKMHGFKPTKMLEAMDEIYEKIDVDLDFTQSIPECDDFEDSEAALKKICIKELKRTGRWNDEYKERLKYEISVINKHGLCDYFLIVRDYVKYAEANNIYVGPGRGSCGGSLVTNLLNITKIDPIVLGTDFDRFLRPDKKKMPDIDIDFENGRQVEVIEYIINKYKGRASRIITFGYYKTANLVNDIAKVMQLEKEDIESIKRVMKRYIPDMAHFEFEDINYNEIIKNKAIRDINIKYNGFIKHFCKLCGQAKYYGQHPAGVLVTKGRIDQYVPLMKVRGQMICAYDKYDVEGVDMVKFDVLALKTLNVIHEIEEMTNDRFVREEIPPKIKKKMYKAFSTGDTAGVFQLNKEAAQNILIDIKADNIQDVIAAISLNRPGTLQLKTHEAYAENKRNVDKSTVWYPYTKDAYGSIIYQEHVMRICKGLAEMEPAHVDKLMKFKFSESEREMLKEEFIKGAKKKSNVPTDISAKLFDAMALYMFNKGHGAGYALISEWQMYQKVAHPLEFWMSSLKYEIDEYRREVYKSLAVKEGCVILLPHVNGSVDYSITELDGDKVIQEGISTIKGVGEKAAKEIIAMGPFIDFPDFEEKLSELPKERKRCINKRVISVLKEAGAFEFNEKKFLKRVVNYNATLYGKEFKMR